MCNAALNPDGVHSLILGVHSFQIDLKNILWGENCLLLKNKFNYIYNKGHLLIIPQLNTI